MSTQKGCIQPSHVDFHIDSFSVVIKMSFLDLLFCSSGNRFWGLLPYHFSIASLAAAAVVVCCVGYEKQQAQQSSARVPLPHMLSLSVGGQLDVKWHPASGSLHFVFLSSESSSSSVDMDAVGHHGSSIYSTCMDHASTAEPSLYYQVSTYINQAFRWPMLLL